MVRGKTEMKRIENVASRQVTFSKRRNGLLKKAFELSVLCDVEVALVIFSHTGKLFEFSNNSINKTLERYQKNHRHQISSSRTVEENIQILKKESLNLEKTLELLELSKRKLLGAGLETCSIDELQQIEDQIERSLSNIRAKKSQVLKQRIEQLKQEGKKLAEENAKLKEECCMQPRQPSTQLSLHSVAGQPRRPSTKQQQILAGWHVAHVVTELFIGPPEQRCDGSSLPS